MIVTTDKERVIAVLRQFPVSKIREIVDTLNYSPLFYEEGQEEISLAQIRKAVKSLVDEGIVVRSLWNQHCYRLKGDEK